MSDSPEFRAWADAAHRDSLRKPKTGTRNPRYGCTSCNNLTTKNQAKTRDYNCLYCKSPLLVKAHLHIAA